jgi:hypothetical protein
MPRPEYLNCVMTPNIIHAIRSEQEYYDQNPERAEREQQLVEEHRQEQMQRDREDFEQMQREHEDWGKIHEIEQQKSEAPVVSIDEVPF